MGDLDSIGVFVEPCDDVSEDNVNIVVGLSGCQAVPHLGIELYGLVSAPSFVIQSFAHFRVCHCVCFPVQYEERKRYLIQNKTKTHEKNEKKKMEIAPCRRSHVIKRSRHDKAYEVTSYSSTYLIDYI